tara:strand:- start:45 stop:704 length:660 start_codon:yes stop_codon:yes gene_type:complete
MKKLIEKIEKAWCILLNQKSKNYLLRAKIDQNIAITNSNLTASFLGNRQLANHNTADIRYCLNEIVQKNSAEPDSTRLNVELLFLRHQQKLNKQLLENSKALILAIEQLQKAHQRIMRTNEEIVSFNSSMLEATGEIISTDQLPIQMRLDMDELLIEVEKIEKSCLLSDKSTQKLMTQIEEITVKNEVLSEELSQKREKIIKNRDRITGVRADLSIWTN